MTFAYVSQISVDELYTSRTFANDNGQWTCNRSFLAYPNTADANVGLTGLMQHPAVPKLGDRHPELATMIVVGHEMNPIEDHAGAYGIVVKYAGGEMPGGGGGNNSTTPGFVTEAVNMRVVYIDVWRTGGDFMLPDGNTTTDIGGDCVDTAGQPYSYPLPLVELQVTENLPHPPYFNAWAGRVAKRNSQSFAHAEPGQVVYFGATSKQMTPEIWQVTHTFVWDKHMKHRRQQAKTDETGRVSLGPKEGVDSFGFCADTVTWVQPFPVTSDFNQGILFYSPY